MVPTVLFVALVQSLLLPCVALLPRLGGSRSSFRHLSAAAEDTASFLSTFRGVLDVSGSEKEILGALTDVELPGEPLSLESMANVRDGGVVSQLHSNGLVEICLNEPRKLNALTVEMNVMLLKVMKAVASEPERVCGVLVRSADATDGEQSRAFCAGGDIKSFVAMLSPLPTHQEREALAKQFLELEYSVLLSLHSLGKVKPVVVLGSGVVMGAGAGMFMGGSFRLVTDTTTFAMPECAIGICPDAGSTSFLTAEDVGMATARFMAVTGARLGASEMLASGLATHAVPSWHLKALIDALREITSDTEPVNETVEKNAQAIEDVVNLNSAGARNRINGNLGGDKVHEGDEAWGGFEREIVEGVVNWQTLKEDMERVTGCSNDEPYGPVEMERDLLQEREIRPQSAVWVDQVLNGMTDGSQNPTSQIVAAELLNLGSWVRKETVRQSYTVERERSKMLTTKNFKTVQDSHGQANTAVKQRALQVELEVVSKLAAQMDFEEGTGLELIHASV